MHCTIGGTSVKALARALQALARLGKDFIFVEPGDSGLCVRAINSSHSAFGMFSFPRSFCTRYWVETEHDPAFNIKLLHCRLSVKSVQGIVRSLNVPRHVESCTLTVRPEEDRVKVELLCRYKVVKVQFLPVIAWESLELQVSQTPDMSNRFTATAKQLTDVLVNFYPNPNDITIIVTAQNLFLQNYIDEARDPKKERRTEMLLHAGEFHDYHVSQKSQVTFNVKDWKAVLAFAGAFTLPVSVNFQKAGRPIVFKVQREGLFEAKFVLSTVLPLSNIPASENNIPDSALTISKKLAEKHGNVDLYKALERKRMSVLNKAGGSRTEGASARAPLVSHQGKKIVSQSADAFCASDLTSVELSNEWLPEEEERDKAQGANRKRSFVDIEPVNNDDILAVTTTKCAANMKALRGEREESSVNGRVDDERSEQFYFANVGDENEVNPEDPCVIARNENREKKLRLCSKADDEYCETTPGRPQLLSPHSVSEKINTVFRCCFREPFDITKLPGYDEVLAEDSDGESCR
ncbi:cell cycle checkpoint control protein RAD9A-like [Bacillus rossius redtenbacheri]|uniref:cell cycle checkpoint control protein RAD9A-like n=1 Tax=Bacillus rossius redtenbacheri TaxID=93214 RepID=UPI002FDED3BA